MVFSLGWTHGPDEEIVPRGSYGKAPNKTDAMLKAEQAAMEALKPYADLYDKLTEGNATQEILEKCGPKEFYIIDDVPETFLGKASS